MNVYYKEAMRLNDHPVNQAALKFLEKLPPEWGGPNPGTLYLLQLMFWGLQSGKVFVDDALNPDAHSEMEAIVLALLEWGKPSHVMEMLLQDGPTGRPEEPWVSVEELQGKRNPEEAAQYLIENLQAAVQYRIPPEDQA